MRPTSASSPGGARVIGLESVRAGQPGDEDRGVEDRDVEDRGVEDRGVEDRGVEDRDVEDRDVEDRDVEDRDVVRLLADEVPVSQGLGASRARGACAATSRRQARLRADRTRASRC
jgi:hypothetical protein